MNSDNDFVGILWGVIGGLALWGAAVCMAMLVFMGA